MGIVVFYHHQKGKAQFAAKGRDTTTTTLIYLYTLGCNKVRREKEKKNKQVEKKVDVDCYIVKTVGQEKQQGTEIKSDKKRH